MASITRHLRNRATPQPLLQLLERLPVVGPANLFICLAEREPYPVVVLLGIDADGKRGVETRGEADLAGDDRRRIALGEVEGINEKGLDEVHRLRGARVARLFRDLARAGAQWVLI